MIQCPNCDSTKWELCSRPSGYQWRECIDCGTSYNLTAEEQIANGTKRPKEVLLG